MNLHPLGNRVMIKEVDRDTITSGGIHIPGNAQNKDATFQGRIIACGPGGQTPEGVTMPMTVEVGQVVIYPKYGGAEVEIDGETYTIVAEQEILGIVHD